MTKLIKLNYSKSENRDFLSNYCDCMIYSKIKNKFKTLPFDDEYMRKVNSINWESDG